MRLSDLIVAVARPLLATDPTLAALLAASPRPTLDANVRVLEWEITMDGGHVATEVMLAREGASAGWMQTHMGLGPVRVVGLPVGLEIEGSSKGSGTIRALILLLRVVGNQVNLLVVHAGHVWLRGGGRRRDSAGWSKGCLAANDRPLHLDTSGGGVFGH